MYTIRFIFVVWIGLAVSAQSEKPLPLDQGVTMFHEGYSEWNAEKMESARTLFSRVADRSPGVYEPFYWRGVAEFFLVLYYGEPESGVEDREAEEVLRKAAQQTLKAAIAINPQDAECRAMLSVLYGRRIAAHPWMAVWLGSELGSLQTAALKNGPDDPRVQYLAGAGCHRAPKPFGNGQKAVEHLRKAGQLFENEQALPPAGRAPRWGFSECFTLLGSLAAEEGDTASARRCYQAALRHNSCYKPAREKLEAMGE